MRMPANDQRGRQCLQQLFHCQRADATFGVSGRPLVEHQQIGPFAYDPTYRIQEGLFISPKGLRRVTDHSRHSGNPEIVKHDDIAVEVIHAWAAGKLLELRMSGSKTVMIAGCARDPAKALRAKLPYLSDVALSAAFVQFGNDVQVAGEQYSYAR